MMTMMIMIKAFLTVFALGVSVSLANEQSDRLKLNSILKENNEFHPFIQKIDRDSNPTDHLLSSYWLRQRDSIMDHQSSDLLEDTDICIIGAGISGIAVAYHLVETEKSNRKITVLEARGISEGATGRNGGHLAPRTYKGFTASAKKWGLETWTARLKFETECLAAMLALIYANGWEDAVELTLGGTLRMFFSEAEVKEAQEELAAMRNVSLYGGDYWNASFSEKNVGTKGSYGAVFNPFGGHFWPAKFVWLLTEKIIAKGVQIYTHTPVDRLNYLGPLPENVTSGAPRWHLTTPRGTLKCETVIHCTNGYVSKLLPSLENRIIPVRGQALAATPPPSQSERPSWPFGLGVNHGFQYAVWRHDNVVILGGGREVTGPNFEVGTIDDSTINESVSERLKTVLKESLSSNYSKENWTILQEWTGIMGYSEDTQPWCGALSPEHGQYISAGFHGHGMPVTYHCAWAVAQQVLGKEVTVPGFTDLFLPSKKINTPGAIESQRRSDGKSAKLVLGNTAV